MVFSYQRTFGYCILPLSLVLIIFL